MKVKITVLAGGLGNQIFQLAYNLTSSTADRRIIDPTYLNCGVNEKGLPEIFDYELPTCFELASNKSSWAKVSRPVRAIMKFSTKKEMSVFEDAILLISKALVRVSFSFRYRNVFSVTQAIGVGYSELSAKDNDVAIGYFQSYKWLDDSPQNQEILRNLQPRKISTKFREYEKLAVQVKPLGIHIRLGDYLNEPTIGIIPVDYYLKALQFHLENYEYGQIWLFSNDPEKALTYFPQDLAPVVNVISNDLTSVETLEVMRLCHGYIIANSTFSWWGAYLTKNPSGAVVCPDKWFKNAVDPVCITPARWKKLPSFKTGT